ncbi:MAG: restriction endonuclease subunit S [Dokdonella sp.]|uniref:restriction endonuclease subunit S n=1 Tax=Dokdonella sp. TaxID=2291710 RepID=UPI0025BDE2BE|nr:restriction endonuclease subunit S [Dokdonella sp.]MBZ0224049.1 restriction endonuclease subunit S [Dokdonella sp.]
MTSRLDASYAVVRKTGVPTGWREKQVADLVRVVGGGTPDRGDSAYWRDGGTPWITPTDLTANKSKYIREGAEHISETGLVNSNATLVPPGSIIFSTRGTVGNLAIAGVPLTTNQSCETLVPNHSEASSEFLYYLLNFGMFAFHRLAGGTTFGAITRREIGRVWLAMPSPDEQAAIARVLDAVDAAIDRAREAVIKAEMLDHSLLHDFLDRGKKRPVHWQHKRVGDVAEVGSGVTLGKDVTGFKHIDLPYLRVANVQDGHLDLSTVKTVKVRVDEVERYRLEPGDVLMTEGGDLDKLGRGTLWEGQIPDCLHQNHIFRVRTDRSQLDPRFFALVVESDIAKRYFNRVAKRTTNLASTNKTQVRAFAFPLPSLTEQAQIAEVMGASKAALRALKSKCAALEQLKKSLMHDLLTGTVRVDPALFAKEATA